MRPKLLSGFELLSVGHVFISYLSLTCFLIEGKLFDDHSFTYVLFLDLQSVHVYSMRTTGPKIFEKRSPDHNNLAHRFQLTPAADPSELHT